MSDAQTITTLRSRVRPPLVDLKLAARLHEALLHAEHCLDQAFIATTELTTLLPSMRAQTNLAFQVTQEAMEAGTVTITSLSRARADLCDMHNQLAQLRDRVRVPATAFGPWEDKPPPPPPPPGP